jgi:hypothetical protein
MDVRDKLTSTLSAVSDQLTNKTAFIYLVAIGWYVHIYAKLFATITQQKSFECLNYDIISDNDKFPCEHSESDRYAAILRSNMTLNAPNKESILKLMNEKKYVFLVLDYGEPVISHVALLVIFTETSTMYFMDPNGHPSFFGYENIPRCEALVEKYAKSLNLEYVPIAKWNPYKFALNNSNPDKILSGNCAAYVLLIAELICHGMHPEHIFENSVNTASLINDYTAGLYQIVMSHINIVSFSAYYEKWNAKYPGEKPIELLNLMRKEQAYQKDVEN